MANVEITVDGIKKSYSVNPQGLSPLKLLKLLDLDRIREGAGEDQITEILLQALYGENEAAIFQEAANLFPGFATDFIRSVTALPGGKSPSYALKEGGEVTLISLIAAMVDAQQDEVGPEAIKRVGTNPEIGFSPKKAAPSPVASKRPLVGASVQNGFDPNLLRLAMANNPGVPITSEMLAKAASLPDMEDEMDL